ncbi:MAG TPA: response regulator transcription factor [Verrucomicrobiae bacterium]|nr:response regulator transcription factor [Verrucomicrobiae bacterium]
MNEPRSKRIRIILVDDHPVVRQGLRKILSTFEQIAVEGEAGSGREAIELARELRPDVVVMDISMPQMSGIEATSILRRDLPEIKVLALSMHEDPSYVKQALRAGARGYMLKDSPPKDLVDAIANVNFGTVPMSPQAANNLSTPNEERKQLTPREIQVLCLIARGLTNKEIGNELGLGVRTIETHRENLIHKTGLPTVPELTRYAVLNGYVELNPVK